MANRYTVFSSYELWIRVFVGEGQLGGVSLTATKLSGEKVQTPCVPKRQADGSYQANLGSALAYEQCTLSSVGDVLQANMQSTADSLTVTLSLRAPGASAGPEAAQQGAEPERWPKSFSETGTFDAQGQARLTLDVMIE